MSPSGSQFIHLYSNLQEQLNSSSTNAEAWQAGTFNSLRDIAIFFLFVQSATPCNGILVQAFVWMVSTYGGSL